jgi:phenylalanyl-tRNA synthetase beta chain
VAGRVGLHDLCGAVEHLAAGVRPGVALLRAAPETGVPGLAPGVSVEWRPAEARGEPIAWGGALHPDLSARWGLDADLLVAEVDLDRLLRVGVREQPFESVPRVPAVSRDLSMVLPRSLPFERVRGVLVSVEPPAPMEWEVTDRYEGAPLSPDEVSLTVRVILQPLDRTLTDAETETYRAALVEALRAGLGIRLRETPAGN